MALSAGARFGPHEILAPIGAGGMSEVFLAQYSKLAMEPVDGETVTEPVPLTNAF
jgi:hypothetical protein